MTTDSAWEPTAWVYIDPDATQFNGQVLGWEWRDDIEDVEEFVQYIRQDISDAAVAAEREALTARVKELEEALDQLITAADFYSQPGTDGMASRYAHESHARLARAALAKGDAS